MEWHLPERIIAKAGSNLLRYVNIYVVLRGIQNLVLACKFKTKETLSQICIMESQLYSVKLTTNWP